MGVQLAIGAASAVIGAAWSVAAIRATAGRDRNGDAATEPSMFTVGVAMLGGALVLFAAALLTSMLAPGVGLAVLAGKGWLAGPAVTLAVVLSGVVVPSRRAGWMRRSGTMGAGAQGGAPRWSERRAAAPVRFEAQSPRRRRRVRS